MTLESGIISFITNFQQRAGGHIGYILVFLAAFLEATTFVGVLIPGGTIVALAGFFSRLKLFDFWDIVFIAAIGAILGDLLSYYLGRKYGHNFLLKYGKYLLFKEAYYKKTRTLMKNHPGKSIIFGRFNQIIRSFAPFIAGSSGINFAKFMFFNILGGMAWAFSYAGIGYIFGESFKLALKHFEEISFIFLTILIFTVYLFYLIKKRNAEKILS